MAWFGHFLTALLWIGVALFSVCGFVFLSLGVGHIDDEPTRTVLGYFAAVVGCCILVALLVSIGVA